jgi:four helix bundle protein
MEQYHDKLKRIIDTYIHIVYDSTEKFPKEEIYGLTSQYRRAAISIMLNYVEGYARQRTAVYTHFLEISYGSFKECCYLTDFCFKRGYITMEVGKQLHELEKEIGAMLWSILSRIKA